MVSISKMKKQEVEQLYDMATQAFDAEYQKFGVYPPLLKTETKSFLLHRYFSYTIRLDDTMIGAVFAVGLTKKGSISAIFIDPDYQDKGYGTKALKLVEEAHKRVKVWRIEAPNQETKGNIYENSGYQLLGGLTERNGDMSTLIYEKIVDKL